MQALCFFNRTSVHNSKKEMEMNDFDTDTSEDVTIYAESIVGESLSAGKALYHFEETNDSSGSTRTKGKITLIDYGSHLELKLYMNVRKSGYTGNGKGAISFQILDSNFNPIVTEQGKRTVGAKFPEGVNDKTFRKTVKFSGASRDKILKDGFVCAGTINTLYDRNGLPENIKDWTQLVKDLAPIIALYYGDSTAIATWFFTKIAEDQKT
jgi:hypothetical protein